MVKATARAYTIALTKVNGSDPKGQGRNCNDQLPLPTSTLAKESWQDDCNEDVDDQR